jgi:hypothetical protein
MHIEPVPRTTDAADLPRTPSPPTADATQEITQLRTDVATRLRRVCGDMPPAAFDALVDDICAMKVRWARKPTHWRDD